LVVYTISPSPFLRARASILATRISYSYSVRLSVRPGDTSRYRSKTRWDRDFEFYRMIT